MKLTKSIIIEGPDGAGKSQLYAFLTRSLGLRAAGHDGGPPRNEADAWRRLAMTAAQSPAVRDRTPAISDIVYSQIFERKTVVTQDQYKEFLFKFNPLIIYCDPPNSVILQQEVKAKLHKPEDFVEKVKAQRGQIISAYRSYMTALQSSNELDIYLYDWTQDPDASKLVDWLRWREICVA